MGNAFSFQPCGFFLSPLNNAVIWIELPFRLPDLIGSFVLFRTKPCCNKYKTRVHGSGTSA